MWTYDQSSGVLSRAGETVATGYSGKGVHKNKPASEALRGEGPIPAGQWLMTRVYDSRKVGPYAIALKPVGHDAHGRSAFLIHGDSISRPGTASNGCIIMPRKARERVWTSGDRDLRVTA